MYANAWNGNSSLICPLKEWRIFYINIVQQYQYFVSGIWNHVSTPIFFDNLCPKLAEKRKKRVISCLAFALTPERQNDSFESFKFALNSCTVILNLVLVYISG